MVTSANSDLPKFRDVDISELVKTQRTKVADVLFSILEVLKKEEKEQKKKFMDEKLLEIFQKFPKLSTVAHRLILV